MNWLLALAQYAGQAFDILKSVFNVVKEVVKYLYNAWADIDQKAFDVSKSLGFTREQAQGLRRSLIQNQAELAALYNVDAQEMGEFISQYAKDTNRGTVLAKENIKTWAALKNLGLSEEFNQMNQSLDKMGGSFATNAAFTAQISNNAKKYGLNMKTATDAVAKNLSSINRYGFKNGVDGLTRMSMISQRLKVDMKEIASASEKFENIGDAIENAAKIQLLGGQAAMAFGNGLSSFATANLDQEGFMNMMIKAGSDHMTWNEDLGAATVKENPYNRKVLTEIAKSLGMNYDSYVTMLSQNEKSDKIEKIMGSSRMEEFKKNGLDEFIKNNAQIKNGKAYITDAYGNSHDISNLNIDTLKAMQPQIPVNDIDTNVKNISGNVSRILDAMEGRSASMLSLNEQIQGAEKSFRGDIAAYAETPMNYVANTANDITRQYYQNPTDVVTMAIDNFLPDSWGEFNRNGAGINRAEDHWWLPNSVRDWYNDKVDSINDFTRNWTPHGVVKGMTDKDTMNAMFPKEAFHDGGIVGGSDYSGDNILARLNSNEAVYTTGQQDNLINNYNDLFKLANTNQLGLTNHYSPLAKQTPFNTYGLPTNNISTQIKIMGGQAEENIGSVLQTIGNWKIGKAFGNAVRQQINAPTITTTPKPRSNYFTNKLSKIFDEFSAKQTKAFDDFKQTSTTYQKATEKFNKIGESIKNTKTAHFDKTGKLVNANNQVINNSLINRTFAKSRRFIDNTKTTFNNAKTSHWNTKANRLVNDNGRFIKNNWVNRSVANTKKVFDNVSNYASNKFDTVKNVATRAKNSTVNFVKNNPLTRAYSSAKNVVVGAKTRIANNSFVKLATNTTKNIGEVGRKTMKAFKRALPKSPIKAMKQISNIVQNGGFDKLIKNKNVSNVTKTLAKATKYTKPLMSVAKPLLKKLPVIGTMLTVGGSLLEAKGAHDTYNAKVEAINNDPTLSKEKKQQLLLEAERDKGRSYGKTAGSVAGALLGGSLTAAIPVVGPFLAPFGAMAGEWVGKKVGGFIGEKVVDVKNALSGTKKDVEEIGETAKQQNVEQTTRDNPYDKRMESLGVKPYNDHINPYFKEGEVYYDDRLGGYVRNTIVPQQRTSAVAQDNITSIPTVGTPTPVTPTYNTERVTQNSSLNGDVNLNLNGTLKLDVPSMNTSLNLSSLIEDPSFRNQLMEMIKVELCKVGGNKPNYDGSWMTTNYFTPNS